MNFMKIFHYHVTIMNKNMESGALPSMARHCWSWHRLFWHGLFICPLLIQQWNDDPQIWYQNDREDSLYHITSYVWIFTLSFWNNGQLKSVAFLLTRTVYMYTYMYMYILTCYKKLELHISWPLKCNQSIFCQRNFIILKLLLTDVIS